MQPQDEEQSRWFAEAVRPHEAELRAFLHRRFPALADQDVDDLVQETYLRLFRAQNLARFNEVRPYLFAMARNAAHDVFRRRQIATFESMGEMDRMSLVEDGPDAAEAVCQDQELALLADAIRSLPHRCRQALTLRKLHGLSHREIAAELGISENTVNAQIAAGVLRCRAYLLAHGVNRETLKQTQLRVSGSWNGS